MSLEMAVRYQEKVPLAHNTRRGREENENELGELRTRNENRGRYWKIACLLLLGVGILVARVHLERPHRLHKLLPGSTLSIANYTTALQLALQFLDVQKSGKLPSSNPFSWRGDSALNDGSDNGVNLTGGLYDAGDQIKFGLPMAFTATLLSWSVLEYASLMEQTQQLVVAMDSIRWVTDYLIKAHVSSNEFYFQVGDAEKEHHCWERPENNDVPRPSYKLNTTNPGSDVAAESAAAMAAASMVFRTTDPEYSDSLLKHASELFQFADTYKASYSVTNPVVQAFYNSTGFTDELLWGASWLYYATGNISYLDYVTSAKALVSARLGQFPLWFSWDDKTPGLQVLLARLQILGHPLGADNSITNALWKYRATADGLICTFLPQSPSATAKRTKGGLIWLMEWNPLQHALNSGLLALFYSDYLVAANISAITCSGDIFTPKEIRSFAAIQADYVLGVNPLQQSFMVGYGSNYPKMVHHRGASIPNDGTIFTCKDGFVWYNATTPNPNVAIGAVVGGPFLNDTYVDSRENAGQNEPTTYNSAAMAGLAAGLSNTGATTVPLTWT
ncbi:unnamed protein product [Sphagnum jensenii]|uniref:Endoglucanase n=1 Tax=Sphagnum jensenii TaxID=128206 RepID=A0ABP0WB49_9BRYO